MERSRRLTTRARLRNERRSASQRRIQASVAELPGAISLGADVEEARRNLDEAIEMVLEGNRLLAEDVAREKISSEEIAFRAA